MCEGNYKEVGQTQRWVLHTAHNTHEIGEHSLVGGELLAELAVLEPLPDDHVRSVGDAGAGVVWKRERVYSQALGDVVGDGHRHGGVVAAHWQPAADHRLGVLYGH